MIDKILNPNTKVGDIFPNDVTQAKNIYRDLCKKYHPDTFVDDRANDIISALTKLYNNAIKAIEAGTWEKSNFIAIKTTKGTTLNINYLYHRVFELGEYYVCNQYIIYIFDFNKKKYYNNYIKQINKISYKDKKMEKYFKNLFPQVISEYNTLDNKHIIVISKTEDVYPLRAVIENVFNGEIPDKHLAWMISRLINICCFLKMNGLVHNGINIDNCFVSTDFHSILLEADRGINKHGSCGVGVFETIYRNKDGVDFKNPVNINPAAMTVGEFMRLSVLNKIDFLDYLRKNYVPKRFDDFGLKNISVEFMNVLTSNAVIMNFIDDFEFMIEHSKWANDDILNYYDNVIFEGGQGLLLDQYNMDYFPNLTPSNTGMKNPATILNALDYKGEVEVCYVTRSYMTRHGVGRFDTECEKKNINPNMIDITNVPNIFQDSLRYGYLDYNELKERILKDVNNNPLKSIVKISLAITHMNEYKIELKDEKIFDNCYISTGYTRTSVY